MAALIERGVPARPDSAALHLKLAYFQLGDHWWLVALWSAVGGAAYALSGRRWMHGYRGDPAAHARGESLAWLALITAAAIGGLALLVLNA